jgi:hypothetical protein
MTPKLFDRTLELLESEDGGSKEKQASKQAEFG